MTSLCEKILITDVLKLFDYHDIYIWVVLRDDRISWHRYLNRIILVHLFCVKVLGSVVECKL